MRGSLVKIVSFVVLSVVLTFSSGAQAFAFSGSGVGVPGNKFNISTCAQLQEMRDNLSAHYQLVNDIDCTGVTNWEPIGVSAGAKFSGSLDGQSYSISNLTYNGDGPAGLFGYTDGTNIANLSLYNVSITATQFAGALIGDAINTTISNVRVSSSTISTSFIAGGLIAAADNVSISNTSTVSTTVQNLPGNGTPVNIGGLMGISQNSDITTTYTDGIVNSRVDDELGDRTSGFIANSDLDQITNSYSTASVTGYTKVGGLIADAASTSLTAVYFSGSVTGNSEVGGLIAYEGLSVINDSFSSGVVTGVTTVGGLIGHAVAIGGGVVNSTWDSTRSTVTDCTGLDESISFPTTCVPVNVANSQPTYFVNNATNEPLDNWNFATIWRTTASYPILNTIPDRVDNVQVVRAQTSLTVTWELPADGSPIPISSYDLKYREASASVDTYTTVIGLAGGSPSTYAINGLTPGTEYVVEIRANNSIGSGIWSGFITTTLPRIVIATTSTTPDITVAVVETAAVIETPLITPSSAIKEVSTGTAQNDDPSDIDAEATPATDTWTPLLISTGVIAGLGIVIWIIRLMIRK